MADIVTRETAEPCFRSTASACRLALLTLCLAAGPGAARGQEPPEGKGDDIRVTRQGGYVERVDTSVDYSDRLPRFPPREPPESLDSFHIVPGFRLDQVAAEPLIRDPVDLTFDEYGRLFVVEMITYSEAGHTRAGRVSRLEDVDSDGRFDRSTVYVDGLMWPTGVTCFDGGIFVASAPDIIYCKDLDGDGRSDQSEVVITGFDTSNPNAFPNSLQWGLDSRIHGMSSTAGGMLHAPRWESDGRNTWTGPIQCRGRDFSIHPRTGELRLESGGGQFGMTFDAWGRKFESSNTAPIEMVMYDERHIARNPFLVAPSPRLGIRTSDLTVYRTSPVEPWRAIRTEMRIAGSFSGPVEGGGTPAGYFTAACGVRIYTGDAWPPAYRGNAFVCEGAGNLLHRMRLEPDGLALRAHRTERQREFLTSDEIWFRPVQLANAPDGCLYIADMYREIFEHPDAVPPSVKKHIDLRAGDDRGRIYRIAPVGFEHPARVWPGELSIPRLVALLEHPNGWHRRTASRLLYERQDPNAVAPLEILAAESSSALGRMHAMYALAGQEALSPGVVLQRLEDSHPRVREHAVGLAERFAVDDPRVRARLLAMATDDDRRVRYRLAFTLGEIPGDRATAALATLGSRDAADAWVRLAVLSSCAGRAGDLLAAMADSAPWRATSSGRTFLEKLAEQAGRQARSDQVARAIRVLEALPDAEGELAQAIVRGLSRGLENSDSPLRERLESGNTGIVLAQILAGARSTASDPSASPDHRAEAVRTLSLAPLEEVVGLLVQLLDSRQPRAVQMAAIRTLGRFSDGGVAGTIIERWRSFSPVVRGEAIEALFARPGRLRALLDAIESEEIVASHLPPTRIEFLLRHPDPEIAERAGRLLGGARPGERDEVVASHRDVLEKKADPERGREVFRTECSTCHRLEGVGHELGLPLNSVKNRGAETILLSILDPNREVNPQYLDYLVITRDGRTLTGIITAETATSITLSRAEGSNDTVLRKDILELRSAGVSIMPEGLEEKLDRQALADVIAYLMSL